MKNKILITLFAITVSLAPGAQTPGTKPLRIADSLTAREKAERNPVLLRSELDSLVKLYAPAPLVIPRDADPVQENRFPASIITAGFLLLVLISVFLVILLYRQRNLLLQLLADKSASGSQVQAAVSGAPKKTTRKNIANNTPEERIGDLHHELNKLARENEGLQGVINEYNGIRQEYDALKYLLQKAYKIRNYPGVDPSNKDTQAIKAVLDTEKALADQAYEKFLKPLLTLTDANKNNPARMSAADKDRVVDLLLSLSFLYIEYLYLRVSDLSVGGTIVERLRGLTGGAVVNEALLKKLNRESGSRALVLRMALDKASIHHLSYPVFDETNLNKV